MRAGRERVPAGTFTSEVLAWWRSKSLTVSRSVGHEPQSKRLRKSRRSALVGGHNVANPPVTSGGVSSYENTLLHTSVVRSAPFLLVNLTLYHEPRVKPSIELSNTVSTVPACTARRLLLVEYSNRCTLVLAVTPCTSTLYSAQLILRSVDWLSAKPCAGQTCQRASCSSHRQ